MPLGATQHAPSSSASPGVRARFAFTLIEVLVAIGIVVALLAVAVPTIVSSFGDRRIEAEAERLAAAMASLRAEAVRQRETLALYLEPATRAYGGELFIGPLEDTEQALPFAGSDSDGSSGGARTVDPFNELDDRPTSRSIFEADRPLTLTIDRPSNDPAQELLGSIETAPAGTFAAERERVRIAVCTGSGQILASRPLWIHDERSMFSVELNAGVGSAILSSRQIIPSGEFFEDEPSKDDPDATPADPAAERPEIPEAPASDPEGQNP